MRLRAELGRLARLCLALGGAAIVAGLVTGWSANSVRKVESSEMLGPRFARTDPAPPGRERPFDADPYFTPSPPFQLTSIPLEFLYPIPAEQVLGYRSSATDNVPFLRPTPDPRSSRVEHKIAIVYSTMPN
jgi:hypothetical protein